MAKPIFIVELPSFISRDELLKITEDVTLKMRDYHVLVFVGCLDTEAKFQCFNSTDEDEIKYKELQELINERIK